MNKRILCFLLVAMFLGLTGIVMAEEYFPPQGAGKGVIGGRNGEPWRLGYFETLYLGESGSTVDWPPPYEDATSTNVLTASECGSTFTLNSATEFATTLPALSTTTGICEFNFIVKAAASGANYTVLTGNSLENKIYGLVSVNSTHVACAAEDTITLVDGNAIGDWVKVKSDGTNWYVTGETLTAAKLTCTQAD